MILTAVRGGMSIARGSARLAAGAASHALWWLDHHVGGEPRKAPADPRRRGSGTARPNPDR